LVLPLQVLDHVRDAWGLSGHAAWHGMWANVQLASYELLREPASGKDMQLVLAGNLSADDLGFYAGQGHLRHVCGTAQVFYAAVMRQDWLWASWFHFVVLGC
jgi:hypothetical protein